MNPLPGPPAGPGSRPLEGRAPARGRPSLVGLLGRVPRLSSVSLTRAAIKALRRVLGRGVRARVFQVGFAFTLSAAARVRVSLAKRVGTGRRARWQVLPYSLTVIAPAGHNGRRLRGHDGLAPGRYHLTLTPLGGAARSIVFQIG